MSNVGKINMNGEYIIGHSEVVDVKPYVFEKFEELTPRINKLKIKRMDPDVIMPSITEGNVGIDLRVLTDNCDAVSIEPGGFWKFHTGIQMEIPQGYYVSIKPRSSTGCKKTLRLMNTEGVIDSNYRGEVIVFIHNFGKDYVTVENNERLCQMVLCKDENPSFVIEEVSELSSTDRGEGGFGSTGRF